MSDLLVIQNITREGLGLLERILVDANVTFDIVDLDKGQQLPSLDNYKALVVLGGPDSSNDTTQKMINELECIKQALGRGLPYLGICLGMQALVKSAGGKVVPGAVKEIGFIDTDGNQHTVSVTYDGKNDPLLVGLPEKLNVFQLHGETVELTVSMKLLATGKFCKNQIVKVGDKAYGIQSHFELTNEMLTVWAEQDPDLISIGKDNLLQEFKVIKDTYDDIGKTLLSNFLRVAGLVS